MINLNNKVILLTGANGLLGREIRTMLMENGANVVSVDIKKDSAAPGHQEVCDITIPDEVEALINSVVEKYGRIDGLVNNAYPRTQDWGVKFEKIPYVSWQKNVDMQLNALFYICQLVLEQMKIQQRGCVVNVGSIYGIVGPDFSVYEGTEMTTPAAYSAIKGGTINFTRYLASYYGRYNVRVNCVSPGGVFDHQPESFLERYNKKAPLGRMATPADIAPSVAFLLSDQAAYISGHNLVIDGGWTAI